MIKNIVFDMGGVLLYWNRQYLLDKLNLNDEEGKIIMEKVFASKEWPMLDRGKYSDMEVVKMMQDNLPDHLKPFAEKLVMHWEDYSYPMPGMADIIRELKANGYGIYLLSNCSPRLHEFFNEIPGSECFDGLVISGDYQIIKPQNEIYQLLNGEFGLTLSECVFIDDTGANIEAAIFNGLKGIVYFGNPHMLRMELKELGVNISINS